MGILFNAVDVATPSQRLQHAAHVASVTRIRSMDWEARARCQVALESPLLRLDPFVPPVDYTRMWFSDLVAFGERWQPSEGKPRPPDILEIQRACAEFYKVKVLDLKSARRTAGVVRPRQVAFYLCKQLTRKSLPEMGRHMGHRDHTTALAAIRKISKLILSDECLNTQILYLTSKLGGPVA